MAIDFTKPATADNYTTVFVPSILANQTALAQLLDSGLVSITGTPPTGAKRYNRTSSALEEWNGSAWVVMPLQGITYSANKIGVNVTPTAGLHVVAPASTTYAKWDAPTAAFGYHQFMQGGVAFGYLGQASGLISGGLGTDLAIRTQGNLIFGQSSTEIVRMDSVGRVGIGTVPVNSAANATNLQIGNPLVAGGSGITIGATTTSDIAFADGVDGSSQFAGMIRYSHASDTMGLWTAGVQRVTIGPLGAVTIASLAAAPGLHVNGGDVTTGAAIQLIGVDRNWQIAQGGTRGGGAGGIAFYDTVSAATRLSISALGLVNAPVGFSGPGSGLTALSADNIASGTLANARTTGATAATSNTLALRDANGDTAVRGLALGNTAVAGANVLDWYEEAAAVSPGMTFGGSSTGWTFSVVAAAATRLGNRVDFSIELSVTAVGAANGIANVTGLPWTATLSQIVSFEAVNLVSVAHERLTATTLATTTRVNLGQYVSATGSGTTLTHANFQVGSNVRVFGTYFV
jgi:hypothetical protein